jgi:hypothetical protein
MAVSVFWGEERRAKRKALERELADSPSPPKAPAPGQRRPLAISHGR